MNFSIHNEKEYGIQKDKYSCGPIAIYSGLVDNHNNKNDRGEFILSGLRKMCNTLPEHFNGYNGTNPQDFERGLLATGFNIRRVNIRELKDYLDRENGAWILFAKEDGSAHYVYVKNKEDDYYMIINNGVFGFQLWTYDELENLLTRYRTDKWKLYRYPMIWGYKNK
tara:strand:+ start:8865 stop:9365 length:501 start_codon:yes stop_codon:yes gene_type:complete